jgi:hypothetical protein
MLQFIVSSNSGDYMVLKRQYYRNGVVLVIIFFSILFYAMQGGITGVSQSGCTCHGSSPSNLVSVIIDGPDQLAANETANYSVIITGGPLTAGGTNISASAGVLEPLAGLRKASNELTHSEPLPATSGTVTFNFTYTAPETTGDFNIFAAGNSVNLNGSNSGDAWNFAPVKTITVNPVTSIDDENLALSFNLSQNYPNPFNPSTKISYEIPDDASGSPVSLIIYDLLGREVAQLINEVKSAGRYEVNFNGDNLNSGVYIYELKTGKYSDIKKMVLMK